MTQRPFLTFSEVQVRVDGVGATSRHRDAVDVAVREPTCLARESRQFSRRRNSRAGREAVQELMRDLTSGDPVVILAGYPSEMEGFLRVNPGLGRRFQVRFDFKDYDVRDSASSMAH